MTKIPAWLTYTLLRLAAFVVPFTIFMLLGITGWLSALIAAIVGLCLSYIFLSRSRNAVSTSIYEARVRKAGPGKEDMSVEDALLDGTEAPASIPTDEAR